METAGSKGMITGIEYIIASLLAIAALVLFVTYALSYISAESSQSSYAENQIEIGIALGEASFYAFSHNAQSMASIYGNSTEFGIAGLGSVKSISGYCDNSSLGECAIIPVNGIAYIMRVD